MHVFYLSAIGLVVDADRTKFFSQSLMIGPHRHVMFFFVGKRRPRF